MALLPLASLKWNKGLESRGQPREREPFHAVVLKFKIQDWRPNREILD